MTKTEMLAAAASIGAAVKESEVMREYRLAEAEYGKDAELQAALTEYSVQQQALANAQTLPLPDPDLTEALKKRIDELYGVISRSDTYERFEAARGALSALVEDINGAMIRAMTDGGEEQEGRCTGDCATCGGCASR